MNVSKINALLNIVEGIKATNELLDLPVEWRNGFVDAKNLIHEARESERSTDGKSYTLIELQQAADRLTMLRLFIEKTGGAQVHIKTLALAQCGGLLVEVCKVIEAIKASR
ncbi:hypothetical protein [Vibrio phage D4]|nr:hypothetical protein [Vibrio phage D4]